MNLRDFAMLTDENISPAVVAFFRDEGFDVWDAKEEGWAGKLDIELLDISLGSNRILVTHDQDFGSLAIKEERPIVGIIYLRPGHISSRFAIESLRAIMESKLHLQPPFLLVAENSGHSIRLRLRAL